MMRPLWTLDEVVAASGGELDLPEQRSGGEQWGLQPESVEVPGLSTHSPPPGGEGLGVGGSSRALPSRVHPTSDPSPSRGGEASAVAAGARSRLAGGATVISGISIDTRSLAPGDLFVALTDARDGHEFVSAAFARDAAAALVRESYARQTGDGALIRVDDPLRGLERIGVAARLRLSPEARVIAVTGSAGKTGTKEMLRACLTVCATSPAKVHAPEKSFNNHWGVPLTLARMPADTEFAVLEIGMNHEGEISALTKMVRPHVAIVTNVLPVHVGNFADGEAGVARAKAEIFEGLKPGGTAIILRDSPHYELLRKKAEAARAKIATFGAHLESEFRRGNLSAPHGNPERQFATAEIRSTGKTIRFEMGMLGLRLATNALAVVAALETLGCNTAKARDALLHVQSSAGRGARMTLATPDGGEVLLLDESYNANPASMEAAHGNLAAVNDSQVTRRIAVLGDMLELGPEAVRYHTDLKEHADRAADLVFCCGPNMRHLFDILPPAKRAHWAPDSAGLIEPLLAALEPGDAVMVKGSLGSRMAPVVDAIKKRFAGS